MQFHERLARSKRAHLALAGEVWRDTRLSVVVFSNRLPQAITRVPSEDDAAVQSIVPSLSCLMRDADALHLAVASRSNITQFASLDKIRPIAADHWLREIECVPGT